MEGRGDAGGAQMMTGQLMMQNGLLTLAISEKMTNFEEKKWFGYADYYIVHTIALRHH